MKKKTIAIRDLVEKANTALAQKSVSSEEKKGICSLVEIALFLAKAYGGFSYIGLTAGSNTWPDEYARKYFVK